MRQRSFVSAVVLAGATGLAVSTLAARAEIGTPATPQQIRAWTTEVLPDGTGLPAGHGSVAEGEVLYETRCQSCHEAPIAPALFGGVGSLARIPTKSVNSYYPDAPVVFDYIRRAMPPTKPGSLTASQVYALCAYIFAQDAIFPSSAELSETSLPKVVMPNRNGFVLAPNPQSSAPLPSASPSTGPAPLSTGGRP